MLRETEFEDARFFAAEARLTEWGLACRSSGERLGLPTASSLSTILHRLKAEESQRRREKILARKQKRLRKRERVYKIDCPACKARIEPGKECPECGKELVTAAGKSSPYVAPIGVQLSGAVAQIETIVASLPGWMRKCVERRYRYGQPDRIAAQELRMSKALYQDQCRAGVERVAEMLQQRARIRP